MCLSLIAAMTPQHVIGVNNHLPWHMPADLKHFKALTLNKTILMGRKTYQSIGRPLAQRKNIIITRDKDFFAPGCEIFHSPAEALKTLNTEHEIFIIGGAQIFAQTINDADYLYLTMIHTNISGDSYFPSWYKSDWEEISHEKFLADEKNPHPYSFVTLKRIRAESSR